MDRLVQADRKASITQIITLDNHGEQESISECAGSQSFSYNNRRPDQIPLLTPKNRNLRLEWAQDVSKNLKPAPTEPTTMPWLKIT